MKHEEQAPPRLLDYRTPPSAPRFPRVLTLSAAYGVAHFLLLLVLDWPIPAWVRLGPWLFSPLDVFLIVGRYCVGFLGADPRDDFIKGVLIFLNSAAYGLIFAWLHLRASRR